MLLKPIVAGAALALAFTCAAAAAECKLSPQAAAGKTAASACKGCHELDPGRPSRPTGPNLSGVYGSKAGAVSDYTRYSEALKAAAAKLTWDEASLSEYIADPKAFLAKTNGAELRHGMLFSLKDEGKRKDITAFLKEMKACK